jgi:serine/threonine protein kinase
MEAESERVTLQDFNMLSLVGYGNYAKIILVRRKVNQKVYAIKIIKKKKEGETNGIKKQHAYIER